MTEEERADNPLNLPDLSGAQIPVPIGIAAVALSMAMKYHDFNMVKDGALYQQYKLEGKNMTTIGMADVFETAIKIERHLLMSEGRIADLMLDALAEIDPPESAGGADGSPDE